MHAYYYENQQRNLVKQLRQREQGTQFNKYKTTAFNHQSRLAGKMLRSLICAKGRSFVKIAEFESVKDIYYDQNCVYTNDLRYCYCIGCCHVCALSSFRPSKKICSIKEYLHVQSPHDGACNHCIRNKCCEPSLLGFSVSSNRTAAVLHFNAHFGYIRTFELPGRDFSRSASLSWNITYKSAVVTNTERRRGAPPRSYTFHLFSVFPIAQLGYIKLTHNAADGRSSEIKDVELSMNMFIVSQGKSTVSLYDAEHIVNSVSMDGYMVHGMPSGPLIIVKGCQDFNLQMGGFPYMFLYASSHGRYLLRNIHNDEIVAVIQTNTNHIEKDVVVFNEDESGKILHSDEHSIRIYDVKPVHLGDMLTPSHPPVVFTHIADKSEPVLSLSGRTLKKRYNDLELRSLQPSLVSNFDLEDELDLIYVLSRTSDDVNFGITLNILDCSTLQPAKTQKLAFKVKQRAGREDTDLEEVFPCSVSGDRDLVIVKYKQFSVHHLSIYQLRSEHLPVISPLRIRC